MSKITFVLERTFPVSHPPPVPPPIMAIDERRGGPRPPVWRVRDGCGTPAKGRQVGRSGCQHPPRLVEATTIHGALTHNPVPHCNMRTMPNVADLLLPRRLNPPSGHVIFFRSAFVVVPPPLPHPPRRRCCTTSSLSAPPPSARALTGSNVCTT